MIYFYHGTDIDKSKIKARELLNSLREKRPDATFLKLDIENFNQNLLQEYIGGQGLFVNKNIILSDRLCEKKGIREQFLKFIEEIAESENIFIILEGKIDKTVATKIEKRAEKTVNFNLSESYTKKEELNIFEIANALGRRDKKKLWILYRELIEKGKVPEEIHGVLFWKIKTMLLSGGQDNWKTDELLKFLDDLIVVYHESRRGVHDLETGLEALLLSM